MTDIVSTAPVSVPAPKRKGSPRRRVIVSGDVQDFAQLGARWSSMTGAEKSSWFRLMKINNDRLQPTQSPSVSAYNTYIQTSTAVLAFGGTPSNIAPAHEDLPPLPACSIRASVINGVLSVILQPEYAYPHKVICYGAKAQLEGQNVYKGTAFALCGALSSLPLNANVTSIFARRFRVPSAGYQVAMKLVGVTNEGLRTAPLFVLGLVGDTAFDAPDTAGEEDALPPYILRIA